MKLYSIGDVGAGLHAAITVSDDDDRSCGKCNDTVNDDFRDSGDGN